MLGELHHHLHHPTVHIPSWTPLDDPTAYIHSPLFDPDFESDSDPDPADLYATDYFRMYEFKVRACMRARSHDWTECPFAHPGEKARRRDPRKYAYSGHACPDFRKGSCLKGDACEYAHGVFECWLHPSRYRTQPCKDGSGCKRRVCFFAHSGEELRVVSPKGFEGLEDLSRVMRNLELSRMNSLPGRCVYGSGMSRAGFRSLPNTPSSTRKYFEEEEGVMERVESGRDLRMKMFERISKESCLGRVDHDSGSGNQDPDVGWVSELLK